MMQFGLSAHEARKQAKQLARERAAELKRKDRAKLAQLRERLKDAKGRRSAALGKARQLCKAGKARIRARVKALRALERDRLRAEVSQLRTRERTACKARKQRVRAAASSVSDQRRKLLEEEKRTQALIDRGKKRAEATQRRSSAVERRQESDESARNDLPSALRPVWDQLKGRFRATGRASRAEAFLEWAQANPDEVLRLQSDEADRDVSRLVREQKRLEHKLAKTKPYQMCPRELETLRAMGIAPTQQAARKRAAGLSKPTAAFAAVPF